MTDKPRTIDGVGPDAPTVENAAGGRQSDSPARLDLLPARAVLAVGAVLKRGAEKYDPDNWRKIDVAGHLNHALVHVMAYLAGDDQDEHLAHAACRMLMAVEVDQGGLSAIAAGEAEVATGPICNLCLEPAGIRHERLLLARGGPSEPVCMACWDRFVREHGASSHDPRKVAESGMYAEVRNLKGR